MFPFFLVSFVFLNSFLNIMSCFTYTFFITIQALDSVNVSIRFHVAIVIIVIDYILNCFWRIWNCFDYKVVEICFYDACGWIIR